MRSTTAFLIFGLSFCFTNNNIVVATQTTRSPSSLLSPLPLPLPLSLSSSVEIVSHFNTLVDGEQNYLDAADLLDDEDFEFLSPKANFRGKNDWLQRFPKFHKDAPIFEDPMPGKHVKQVTRKGKKKISFLTIHLMETYELNDQGKIVNISAAMI
jgi:hypothetical protein